MVKKGVWVFLVLIVGFGYGYWKLNSHEKIKTGPKLLILPHHDLAREIIVQAVNRWAQENASQPVKTIVVISPNHFQPQGPTFTTTKKLKEFKIGQEWVERLAGEKVVTIDENLLQGEHGLITPISYLATKIPDAEFVPIAVSPYYTPEKIEKFVDRINGLMDKYTAIVASVDFAHNHKLEEGRMNNQFSIEAMANFDWKTIERLDDNHMDSPASVTILMKLAQIRNAKNWETWFNAHGAMFLKDVNANSTSYVIGVFR